MEKVKINGYKLGVLAGLSLLTLSICSGCASIGNAPAGPSIDQVKAEFNSKPLDQRAREINQMSIPQGIKQRTIQQMYAKAGKTAPPELLGSGGPRPVTGH